MQMCGDRWDLHGTSTGGYYLCNKVRSMQPIDLHLGCHSAQHCSHLKHSRPADIMSPCLLCWLHNAPAAGHAPPAPPCCAACRSRTGCLPPVHGCACPQQVVHPVAFNSPQQPVVKSHELQQRVASGTRMATTVMNNLNKPGLLSLTARWILKLYGRRQAGSSFQCRPRACWGSFSPLYR